MLILVVGTGRCGSTLPTEIIARHHSVGFVSNVDDKLALLDLAGRWNGTIFRRGPARDPGLVPFRDRGRLLERGRLRVAPSEAWNLLDRQVSPFFSAPCRDLVASDCTPWVERRLHRFIRRRLSAQRTPHLVLHLTGWPRTALFQAAFPDVRVVHVIRDGRAVANSWLHMGWWDGYQGPSKWYLGPLPPAYHQEWERSGRSFPVLAGLGWKTLLDAVEAARAASPADRWLDVRYEDLIADPRATTKGLMDWLGLFWTPQFERGFGRCVFDRSRTEAFRRDLDPAALQLLEASLVDRLRQWGYVLTEAPLGRAPRRPVERSFPERPSVLAQPAT